MEAIRKPFEGIYNIVRFNWHFYALALGAIVLVLLTGIALSPFFAFMTMIASVLIALPLISSLLISYYIYDRSELYTLNWLDHITLRKDSSIVNIHAGFDESSHLLKYHFPEARLRVLDFYDPAKHTEVSIKRARKAYPAFPGTQAISTSALPLEENSSDLIFLILAAHEIRNEQERLAFFTGLKRALKPDGKIIVTEHLRDLPNFLAYTIGFFHFLPESDWKKAFNDSGLHIAERFRITPFINTFILTKHDPTT
jgi:SAM-dependent methyltransferase